MSEITTEDVLAVLSQIWTTKTETAKRVHGRLENVLDYAAAMKWRSGENPARWRGHLNKLLPPPARVRRVRPQPALEFREVPTFVQELRNLDSVSARALEFLILTACRTGEVLGATWQEIDLENRSWTIPAGRTKAHRCIGCRSRIPLWPF